MISKTKFDIRMKNKECIEKPKIIYVTKFTEDSAKAFQTDMDAAWETGQSIIPVVINSPGGSVMSLLNMTSIIESSPIPVATIIEGCAMSCGILLASYGDDGMRYAHKDASMMIHEISSFAWGKTSELKSNINWVNKLNIKVFNLMSINCGHPKGFFMDEIAKRKNADWFLEPREAKKLNLINHIKVPILTTTIVVEEKFE